MSLADGTASANPGGQFRLPVLLPELVGQRTLAGNATLTNQYRPIQRLDPGGSARDVTLPAVENGLWFLIVNTADNAENLVVKNAGGDTIVTANQNESALVWSDGSSWYLAVLFTAPLS